MTTSYQAFHAKNPGSEIAGREPCTPTLAEKRDALAAICRRYGVARLEVFESAARGVDFDPGRSDADFLVTFEPAARNDLAAFADLKDALEALLRRPVDLLEREAVEASRNFIRRQAILKHATTVYG
jgi:predicted nucleotidyltransferase